MIEDKAKDMVEVSIANLFIGIQYSREKIQPVGVFNPRDKTRLQSLSAGPKFSLKAKEYLVRNYNADSTGFSGEDARCRIPKCHLDKFWYWARGQFFLRPEEAIVNWNPFPELKERLTSPYWDGVEPPLIQGDIDLVTVTAHYVEFVRQPPPAEGEDSGGQGAKARFFAHWWLGINDVGVAKKLQACPAIIPLSQSALETTKGGRCVGHYEVGGKVYKLANNIGVQDHISSI